MISLTEENYLKAIYHLSDSGSRAVLTNEIAEVMNTRAASVTDMVKRLSGKGLISYEKYHGVVITRQGKADALAVVRKHRLWETFLVEKLGFSWDAVHEVAEQLEHVQSDLLIEKLDAFLLHPSVDPHGHPIPDKNGKFKEISHVPLSTVAQGVRGQVCAVSDSAPNLLQHLTKLGIQPGTSVEVTERMEFDGSMEVLLDGKRRAFLTQETSANILILEKTRTH